MFNGFRLMGFAPFVLVFAVIGSLSTLRAQYRNDGCVVATSKKDPGGGGGETFFFKNGCPQLVVIKEFVQRADGKWTGGEDCRAHDQWVQAYVNPAGSGRYIAWAQVVKSCSEEFSLKWPPDPK